VCRQLPADCDLRRTRQPESPFNLWSLSGGLITTTRIVENFPGFPEGVRDLIWSPKCKLRLNAFGARVEFGNVEAVDLESETF
jgi:thioredoxin reductase